MLRELRGGPSTHKGQKRHRRRRWFVVAVVVISIATFIILAIVVAYTWYFRQQTNVTVVEQKSALTHVIKDPVPIAKNQNVGVFIIELTSPLKAGSSAAVSVRTLPTAACSVEVIYNGSKSVDLGLIPKNADEYGVARWSWKVEEGQPVGKWPVNITCAKDGKSGFMRGDLVITS